MAYKRLNHIDAEKRRKKEREAKTEYAMLVFPIESSEKEDWQYTSTVFKVGKQYYASWGNVAGTASYVRSIATQRGLTGKVIKKVGRKTSWSKGMFTDEYIKGELVVPEEKQLVVNWWAD